MLGLGLDVFSLMKQQFSMLSADLPAQTISICYPVTFLIYFQFYCTSRTFIFIYSVSKYTVEKDNDAFLRLCGRMHMCLHACVCVCFVCVCVRVRVWAVCVCFCLSERCSKAAELTSAPSALGGTSGIAGYCQAAITLMEMG